MAWATANWFWVLMFIAFIGMHLFGHGAHGAHGRGDRQRNGNEGDKDEAQVRAANTSSGGHQH
jgi:hypothetical protein